MQIDQYLNKYQPIIIKTFTNALKNGHISHAYLLSGNAGMPLKDSALYLAKSLLCDDPNPLACNNCITCLRIDEGNYADVIIIDGETNKIKKSDVAKVIDTFDKTALEAKGIMIYVINLVEMMTPVAINSLLKFLEEPGKNIYAFLTTENEAKILPTILSRTQILRFKNVPIKDIIDDALNEGVSLDDAELLAPFYSDGKLIKDIVESNNYQLAKNALDEQLDALLSNKDEAIYSCQKNIIPMLKNNDSVKLFLKFLSLIFQDLLNKKVNTKVMLSTYDKILDELLKKLKHIDKSLYIIMSSIGKVDLNVNLGLLLDHVIYEITLE